MNEVAQVVDKIRNEYASFLEENAEPPTHLILDIGARQALIMSAHPFADLPRPGIITYLGMPIVNLEDVIIVDSQSSTPTVKEE